MTSRRRTTDYAALIAGRTCATCGSYRADDNGAGHCTVHPETRATFPVRPTATCECHWFADGRREAGWHRRLERCLDRDPEYQAALRHQPEESDR